MENNATSTAALGQMQGANQNLGALVAVLKNAFIGNIRGTFTMPGAATITVTNANVTNLSYIYLTPLNAAAGTLQGSAKCLYTAALNGSFTAKTASGGNAAGTEIFGYTVG